ncbi:hypothetical protein [Anaeromyxobacter dehalogenans]|uniref:hypothetical protein n=1 Tax=Anaeromyxobacter dehalogenans TaxID=161493 RepID=UPI00059B61FF|nr:hypothetical protein [Anaeromyxobacter dehalogenans]
MVNPLHSMIGALDVIRAVRRGIERVGRVEVYGSPEFRGAVVKALRLLRDEGLPAWHTVTRHVGTIVEGTRTTVKLGARPALMFIGAPHSRQEQAFLAATIAYLACSCELHARYEAEHPGHRVPRDVYAGKPAEERCGEEYRACLRALGTDPISSPPGRG